MNLSLKHYRIIKNHYKICIYIDFKLLTDKDDIFLKCPSSFNDSKRRKSEIVKRNQPGDMKFFFFSVTGSSA